MSSIIAIIAKNVNKDSPGISNASIIIIPT